jgi:hypothetical protein
LSEQQIATGQRFGTQVMSTERAPALHRFIALADEGDFLRLGWMRERPLKQHVEKRLGVWLMWPCASCLPVETPSGALCGGRWQPLPTR